MRSQNLHGMIFSGGGADGAYQIGVAKALFAGMSRATYKKPMEPEVLTGTSIGSFNASFLVSHWQDFGPEAVSKLEKVWLERMAWNGPTNGGFRVRLNPFELLDPRQYMEDPGRPLRNLVTDLGVLGWETVNRTYNLFASKDPVLERLTDFFVLSSGVAVEPWERTIRETIDYKKIRISEKQLRIAATNWAFGEVREFRNRDMTDKLGPAAIRASSSVPGVYPPATVGSQTYVDGAVLMNTPLSPAIKAMNEILEQDPHGVGGSSFKEAANTVDIYAQERSWNPNLVLHVIYMNTDVEKMPIRALQSTLQTLYRTQIISWAKAVNRDIAQAKLLNEGLEYVRNVGDVSSLVEREELDRLKDREDLDEKGKQRLAELDEELGSQPGRIEDLQLLREKFRKLSNVQLRSILQAAEALVNRMVKGHPYQPITIHRYFLPDGLDGALGFLDVRRSRFERLIEEGFNNTIYHDCETNGCILAGPHKDLNRDY